MSGSSGTMPPECSLSVAALRHARRVLGGADAGSAHAQVRPGARDATGRWAADEARGDRAANGARAREGAPFGILGAVAVVIEGVTGILHGEEHHLAGVSPGVGVAAVGAPARTL